MLAVCRFQDNLIVYPPYSRTVSIRIIENLSDGGLFAHLIDNLMCALARYDHKISQLLLNHINRERCILQLVNRHEVIIDIDRVFVVPPEF